MKVFISLCGAALTADGGSELIRSTRPAASQESEFVKRKHGRHGKTD